MHVPVSTTRLIGSVLRLFLILKLLLLLEGSAQGQTPTQPPVSFTPVTGYVGILHPIVSFSKEQVTYPLQNYYLVGFPMGINLWKSQRIGFSAEFVPFIRAESGQSRMANFLFHPGALIRFHSGFTLALRAAFETSGRYGFTPVVSKTFLKQKQHSYFLAIPLPLRLGNAHPLTFTPGIQVGISF